MQLSEILRNVVGESNCGGLGFGIGNSDGTGVYMIRAIFRRTALTASILAVVSPACGSQAWATVLTCSAVSKVICKSGECQNAKTEGEYTKIDTDSMEYSLCDLDGGDCARFALVDMSNSGAFMHFKAQGAAYLKMAIKDVEPTGINVGQFMEVRDAFFTTFISWGSCKTVSN